MHGVAVKEFVPGVAVPEVVPGVEGGLVLGVAVQVPAVQCPANQLINGGGSSFGSSFCEVLS